jgi:ubiquitin C-terminal hydrolase
LSIESLIQAAADLFSYDPSSFNLMWKVHNEEKVLNLEQVQSRKRDLKLSDLSLKPNVKNLFEIHETQNGPPKRLKKTNENPDYSNGNDGFDDLPPLESETILEQLLINKSLSQRRNGTLHETVTESFLESSPVAAAKVPLEYGPVNNTSNYGSTSMGIYSYPEYSPYSNNNSNYEDNTAIGYVGLINQAMTCYLNSLLQTLYMTPEFRNAIYRWKFDNIEAGDEQVTDNDNAIKNIPYQLQRLFLNLQTSAKKSIQTHDLTKSFGWNSDDAFQQHDVQELCRVMFDALEKTFKGTQQKNLINELYQGKIKDYVKCLECNIESARVNVFLDISLCIRRFGSDKTYESVEAALDAFVEPEILDEGNKYFCDKCQKMCKAHKGLKFEAFPYIISLQLNRFDFDYSTMSRFKLSNTVTFPEVLDFKKYLKEPEEQTTDDEGLNDKSTKYELFSIMIHSGSATGGHYYAYIKCFETDQWYNFNDERVTKLDRQDIKKAFGTSNSSYSSQTAYMLLYRQQNVQRNEKFISVAEYSDYLKTSLEKEKHFQIEAERLKELMENSCKIKVIVPPELKSSDLNNNNIKKEKLISIHKDLTLDQAKLEIIREFNLSDYVRSVAGSCRILKYDSHNDLIEQSYANESTTTVFEALGFTKYPYNICWYLEILPDGKEFVEYNSKDYNIKLFNLNIQTFETNDLFNLRVKSDTSVNELRKQISTKLNCNEDNLRMALEKPHSLYNYVYLNKNLTETLHSQQFSRVNKVFVYEGDSVDLSKHFEESKFCYALDAIINMLQTVVYLPSEEDCEIFLRKIKRHQLYMEMLANKQRENDIDLNNDLSSKMSLQIENSNATTSSDMTLIEDHFKTETTKSSSKVNEWFDLKSNEMETSLDEGIGGSNGSLSNNNHGKKMSGKNVFPFLNKNVFPLNDDAQVDDNDDNDDNSTNLGDVVDRCYDDVADLDVNIDDDDDFISDSKSKLNEHDPLDSLNSLSNLKENAELYWPNEDLNAKISSQQQINEKSVSWDDDGNTILTYPPRKANSNASKYNVDVVDDDDPLPSYTEATQSTSKAVEETTKSSDSTRFIKSNLLVKNDLGTRTLEIKMDKRIDLSDFKLHISSFLSLTRDNFRVFRMCRNDFECELTSCENQFSYLTQNTEFVIKLGRPLKYGEYVVPVYKLSKEKSSMTYLCDFMILHGLSVLSHKELLCDDLKDECNLDVTVEKIRLRKRNGNKPGSFYLDHEIFGTDIFVNTTTELCIEILDEPDKKIQKSQTCIYLRHWKADEHELSDLHETIIDGNSFELLLKNISSLSGIDNEDLELLKCNRDFPYKSPILDLHKDSAWKDKLSEMDKLEDGQCFYYRNKTMDLGLISDEKRREMVKEDNLNFRPKFLTTRRKETGIKIHVNNS